MNGLRDRVAGVLLGLAAGDRNGGPIRMAVRLAESLVERRGFDAADVGRRYLQWWRNGAFDTGPTVAAVMQLVDQGLPFEEASMRVHETAGGLTGGCNPAHRIAPLAMCAFIEDGAIAAFAQMEARLTHRHPVAAQAAVAVALLCRHLICGWEWEAAIGFARAAVDGEVHRALSPEVETSLSPGGYAPRALQAAVHFVSTSRSFGEALARSLEFAGPDNYAPVLVGSVGGARWGASAVERDRADLDLSIDEAPLNGVRAVIDRLCSRILEAH